MPAAQTRSVAAVAVCSFFPFAKPFLQNKYFASVTGGDFLTTKNGVNTLSASRTTDPNSSYAGSYNGSSHYGVDIACSAGTILKGLGNGTVVGTGYNTKDGRTFRIIIPVYNRQIYMDFLKH